MTTITTKEIASEVGKRLFNLDFVESISTKKENRIPHINTTPWDRSTLSHGYPALVVLYATLDDAYPGEGWDKAAHHVALKLVEQIKQSGVYNASLFSGLTGVCHAIFCASKGKTRYTGLLDELNQLLIKRVEAEYIALWDEAVERGEFVSPQLWDGITGLTGVLPYLLNFQEHPEIRTLTSKIIDRLCALSTSMQEVDGMMLPAFYSPSNLLVREDNQKKYQPGCIDSGMAHGISGVLSVLTKASKHTDFKALCCEPIKQLSRWLEQHLMDEFLGSRCVWSSRYVLSPDGDSLWKSLDEVNRDGWCYGAPGIGRALFVSAQEMGDPHLEQTCERIWAEVAGRFPLQSGLQCPSFCHGYASLLTLSHAMFLDTRSSLFSELSHAAAEHILRSYQPDVPFGFKVYASYPGEKDILIDNPGLLDGVIGVILSLLYYEQEERPPWLDLFFIG